MSSFYMNREEKALVNQENSSIAKKGRISLRGGQQQNTYTYQVAISESMGSWAENNPIAFVMALGDNFYNDGVASTADSMW